MDKESYIAIDLKSFYASVECVERGLDPLTTNLVVADETRTEKTICLAATPSIKAYGISGRSRLFEVVEKVKFANGARRYFAPGKKLQGESFDALELAKNPAPWRPSKNTARQVPVCRAVRCCMCHIITNRHG